MKNQPKSNLSIYVLVIALIAMGISITSITLQYIQPKQKIVYVNSLKLMLNYKGMLKAKDQLEKMIVEQQAKLDTLDFEMKQLLDKVKVAKGKELEKLEEQLAFKDDQIAKFRDIVQQKIQNENNKLTGEVMKAITADVNEFAKSNGYEYIIAQTQYGNVLYGEQVLDVTDQLSTYLNKKYDQKN